MSTPLESKFQREVIEHAHIRGWWCEKVVSQSARGITDLLAVRAGVVLFVECKREGEDLREQQVRRARILRKHGAQVTMVDTMDDARRVFK